MGEVRKNKVDPRPSQGQDSGGVRRGPASPVRPPPTLRRSSLISFEGDDENSRVEVGWVPDISQAWTKLTVTIEEVSDTRAQFLLNSIWRDLGGVPV